MVSFLFFSQIRASRFLCLALFECISLPYRLDKLRVEARKKGDLMLFDVPVLWSAVNILSLKSFCCTFALIKTSKRLVDSTESFFWGRRVEATCFLVSTYSVCVCVYNCLLWLAHCVRDVYNCTETHVYNSTDFNTRMRLFIYKWRCLSMGWNITPPADTRKT